MKQIALVLTASIVAVTLLIWMMIDGDRVKLDSTSAGGEPGSEIVVYCAASNRAVMEAIKDDYESEYGRTIQLQYGGSQTLLSSIEASRKGDLYLPADDSYLKTAKQNDLVAEVLPIALMQGVIAVKKGNPKNIHSYNDLLREDVRVVQAAPEVTAIGKLAKKALIEKELWVELEEATRAFRTTVTDVANDLVIGAADAGIVYDAVLHTYPDLEYIELDELAGLQSQVSIGVVAGSSQTQAGLHFARFLTARDRGLVHYGNHGFRVEGGDRWADIPELTIFAGSMLKPAIDETITAFEKREGVRVTRSYNGCGILVGQMQAGSHPDAYFACDAEFMSQVTDIFPESIPVTKNELVILVEKGNPYNIGSLRDLTAQGLRVGVGHEKQCAMGWLTQNTLKEGGIQKEVMANVTVQSPTGDMLVNQLKAGGLDAAVAYLSNAAGSADVLDAIRIPNLECAIATQPWAVAAESKYPVLASRLFDQICSSESQESFLSEGFTWDLGSSTKNNASAVR